MPAKLFVGNLSFQATEEDLRELFQQAGTVESVRIVTDQFTGRPRGARPQPQRGAGGGGGPRGGGPGGPRGGGGGGGGGWRR